MVIPNLKRPHPLDGPILKIKRAKKHLEELDGLLSTYTAANPYGVRRNLNSEKTFYEYRLIAVFPPFLDFGVVIPEFAYQLRSALDQIIYALSVFPAGLTAFELERAERSVGFPIRMPNNAGIVEGRLKYVPDTIRDRAGRCPRSVPAISSRG